MPKSAQHVPLLVKRKPGTEDLPLPAYQSRDASGMDLLAAVEEDLVLRRGEISLVPTGLYVAVSPGYEAQVRPRSGLALKHGITVVNAPGTIDADYRGEVCVILTNLLEEPFVVSRGMRIAQMVIAPVDYTHTGIALLISVSERRVAMVHYLLAVPRSAMVRGVEMLHGDKNV